MEEALAVGAGLPDGCAQWGVFDENFLSLTSDPSLGKDDDAGVSRELNVVQEILHVGARPERAAAAEACAPRAEGSCANAHSVAHQLEQIVCGGHTQSACQCAASTSFSSRSLHSSCSDSSRGEWGNIPLAAPSRVNWSSPESAGGVGNASGRGAGNDGSAGGEQDSVSIKPQKVWGILKAESLAQELAQESGRQWINEQKRRMRESRNGKGANGEHRHRINRKSAKMSRVRRREYVKQLEIVVKDGEEHRLRLKNEVDSIDAENERLQKRLLELQAMEEGASGTEPVFDSCADLGVMFAL